jgi:hypothetical protein
VQKHWNYNLKHCDLNETATGDNFAECFKAMMFVGKQLYKMKRMITVMFKNWSWDTSVAVVIRVRAG